MKPSTAQGSPPGQKKIWLDTPPPCWEGGELRLRKDGAFRELKPGPQRRLEPRCTNRSLPELRRATLGRVGSGRAPRLPPGHPSGRPPATAANPRPRGCLALKAALLIRTYAGTNPALKAKRPRSAPARPPPQSRTCGVG